MNSFSVLKFIIPALKNYLAPPHLDLASPLRVAHSPKSLSEWNNNQYPSSVPKISPYGEAVLNAAAEEGEGKVPDEE